MYEGLLLPNALIRFTRSRLFLMGGSTESSCSPCHICPKRMWMLGVCNTAKQCVILCAMQCSSYQASLIYRTVFWPEVHCKHQCFGHTKVTVLDKYIVHRYDTILYPNCYLEPADTFPNVKTHIMLGDSFMKIDDLGRAVQLHEPTFIKISKDASVAAQRGKAFVIAHNYTRAIEHYTCALQNIEDTLGKLILSFDLAELFFKLRNYEEAEMVLRGMLAKADAEIQVKETKNKTTLLLCLKGSLLLSKVQHLLGNRGILSEESKRPCPESRYLPQYKVMLSAKNIQNWHIDPIGEQRGVAADIYFHFAQVCEVENDVEKTVTLLKEALNCNPAHSLATLALAKIQLSRGDVTECEQKCADILRADPFNAEAGDTLVQLMLYRELYESAIVHLKQILERDPNHYPSMAQLIRLLRNAGQIDDAQQYILKAETSPTSHRDAGLHYCKGLTARYVNKRFEAVQMFNHSRNDAGWGKQAIYSLIEIYLNIDNELVWAEETSNETAVANEEGIQVAWKLLGETRLLDGKSVKQLVLECYATMATRQRADIEFALGRLSEALETEEHRVPILLAIATARTLLNQTAKAKTQLQVIDRSVYKWQDGETFERAWLMLAGLHIQNGKHDAAEELCRRCLKHNKDCGHALEYLSSIMEARHSFTEALGYLENAWKCQKEASPKMGYRLALTYLKEKMYIEAILVCQKVLKTHNNCPQIKKDILDKARLCVRV